MARIVWKGAISFGLVNIPVVLHPGARTHALDFDWIDRRDFSAVGYRIAPYHFDTPYFLAPDKRGEKGYVLLRETMRRTGKAVMPARRAEVRTPARCRTH